MQNRHYKAINTSILSDYKNNARIHSPSQIAQIAASIKEFGFTAPILIDENNMIIAGHGRLAAAKLLQLTEVPCIILNDLSDSQKRAYVIADNKLTLNADWDFGLLKIEFDALKDVNFNLNLIGFSSAEIAGILPDCKDEPGCDEDFIPEKTETIVKKGDIWILGNHRLMCGDAKSIDDVKKLMNDNKADLIFTDPPYGVSYKSRFSKFDKIKNDDLSAEEFKVFITEICSIITLLDAPYYVWCNWQFYGLLQSMLSFKSCIVWAKNYFGLGNGYRHQHEFCLTNAKIDAEIKNESDLWNIKKDSNYIHPTQKPVELAARALNNHKDAKNIVDLFGGSGSTLIACEKNNRSCYMMEIEERYCDTIISRYEIYSNKKAMRKENESEA